MFIDDLKSAIRGNQPIAPLLDSCIRPPKQTRSPLVSWAIAFFGEQKCKDMVIDVIKDNLFSSIRENQDALKLLNTEQGRIYLHKNLDSLLDYLTSAKFTPNTNVSTYTYKCPACKGVLVGKVATCSHCNVALKWNRRS